MESPSQISSRKQQHVELCVQADVQYRNKATGFDDVELEYCALPELNADEIDTRTTFLGRAMRMPLLVSAMTGGYAQAEDINRQLAECCQHHGLAMGVGSQRQALVSDAFHASFATVRTHAPDIPVIANIGAAEVARGVDIAAVQSLVDLVAADALAVHLNPLQELVQPEGSPRFRGVLAGIEKLVQQLRIPVAVKEVGAGISANVARRLLDVGVQVIDVAGAGGTSWTGVELLRNEGSALAELWDCGIPTVNCLMQVRELRATHEFTMISSGGVSSGFDVAKSIAIGADIAGAARPFLKVLVDEGPTALDAEIVKWKQQLHALMFISGAGTLEELRSVPVQLR